uniref:wiskott-Aldrich syndrome protein homolog 1-like n=1 Tax=Myodes glareolus TaxID=447135 RepID=UPI0020207304|nr:wiskott-Aldrich syndrome protein homolog 1-like [Myodes glareolus]
MPGCGEPLGAGCSRSPLGVRSAPARLQPDSSPTPARLQPGSSPAPALLRLCSSPAPAWLPFSAATPLCELRTSTPSSQLSVPLSLSVPHPRDLAPSQDPVPDLLPPSTPPQSSALSLAPHLPGRQSVCLSASPPSFSFLCPASLVCSLVRLGGAASQENPRNHCKKLTMKFKKFYDFGAIFEWSESSSSTKLDVGKVWLEAYDPLQK